MKRLLIDTSAYSRLLRGSREVLDTLTRAEVVNMSIFVLAELYAGFKGGSKESENRRLLEQFLARPTVQILPATRGTAEVFATIKHTLRRAGHPLPIHDVWIAAHAVETGSVLVTFDAHFRQIGDLHVWNGLP
jgi:tRNA(fMet)-specific endonuclease VapC